MPSFSEAFLFARRRNRGRDTSKRFREILDIVRTHGILGEGLTPETAVTLLEELGATFVKLGQIASTHPDILPAEYCDAFAKLRADVTPMDFETVKGVVEEELEAPLGTLFSDFDEHAVGSASIAQVHRAVLAEDGTVVAVKVQRPGVVETVAEDLAIMERIVELYDLVVPSGSGISLAELLDELARTSRDELDFTIEARHLERFAENNAERENVGSPRSYERYCTSAILTEDYLDSPAVGSPDGLARFSEEERENIASLMAENYLQQVMEDGFYHADPHAGNVLITDAGGIEWIDFGMMGEMTPRERERVMAIAKALYRGDAYSLQRSLLKVVTPTGDVDHGRLIDICETVIDEFVDVDLESFDTSALVNTLMNSLSGGGYRIDPFLASLARGLVTLEGTVRLVSSKLNIMGVVVSYMRSGLDIPSLSRRAQKFAANATGSVEAAAALPTKAMDVLDMFQKGQIRINMDIDVDDGFSKTLADSISYFAFALLACGMIVGSCILCTTALEPRVLGIPVFGFAGFVFGVALMVYVSYLIFRDRRRRRRRRK